MHEGIGSGGGLRTTAEIRSSRSRARLRIREVPWARGFSVDSKDHIVFIVDDDPRVRESLVRSPCQASDMHAISFGSAANTWPTRSRMFPPASSSTSTSRISTDWISRAGSLLAIARRSCSSRGTADIPSSVRAIKAGAVDFLTKPFRDTDLMRAIEAALAQSHESRLARAELSDLRSALLNAHAPRTRAAPTRRRRTSQQAGRSNARHQRDHDPDSSRPHHAQDARRVARRAGQNGWISRDTDQSLPARQREVKCSAARGVRGEP